jgi:hypothetical protein
MEEELIKDVFKKFLEYNEKMNERDKDRKRFKNHLYFREIIVSDGEYEIKLVITEL